MKILKYLFFILAILIFEVVLSYLLFLFSNSSKTLYVLFSLAVLLSLFLYLMYGRYRESIKIHEKKVVLGKYTKRALLFSFIVLILLVIIIIITAGAFIFNSFLK